MSKENGSAGLTGSTTPKDDKKNAEEQPKKKGFGLGSLKQAVAPVTGKELTLFKNGIA